jgi:RNA polymerase sigma-70 factor (ECF subfamily)
VELVTRVNRPLVVGYDALSRAVARRLLADLLLTTTAAPSGDTGGFGGSLPPPGTDAESLRLAALVDLARGGDSDAFGQLFDHYKTAVYRFIYYRVSTQALAEDLTSETFFRALRSISSFHWQGKDFAAWLMTIARNLIVDHHKSARARLESPTSEIGDREELSSTPEEYVLQTLTHQLLREKLTQLPTDQQECIVLRFLNSYSIAETAKALEKSEGAVKQLQLRAIRNLARLMPEDIR